MACPTKYTDKLVADLCRRLADGESLRRICEDPKMPTRATILNWVFDAIIQSFLTSTHAPGRSRPS